MILMVLNSEKEKKKLSWQQILHAKAGENVEIFFLLNFSKIGSVPAKWYGTGTKNC